MNRLDDLRAVLTGALVTYGADHIPKFAIMGTGVISNEFVEINDKQRELSFFDTFHITPLGFKLLSGELHHGINPGEDQ